MLRGPAERTELLPRTFDVACQLAKPDHAVVREENALTRLPEAGQREAEPVNHREVIASSLEQPTGTIRE